MMYIRTSDGAEMIEVAPHQFVNADALARLGYFFRETGQERSMTDHRSDERSPVVNMD